MNAPLSRRQKAVLAQLAGQAYKVALSHFSTDDLDEASWRQREAEAAVGRRISAARNSDYLPLKRHFEGLAGRSGAAFATALREPTERSRQLLYQIHQALAAYGLTPAYAEVLATGPRFRGASLETLTEDQLLQLLMTVHTRGRQKLARPPAGAMQAPE